MKRSKKFRQVGESLLGCLAFALIPLLPRGAVVRLSRGLGSLAFRFGGKLRRVAMANLEVAFGSDLSLAEKLCIARESFCTFALVATDIFWFGVFTKGRINKWVKMDETVDEYLRSGASIAVTGHFGNWEIMGQTVALKGGLDLSVAAPLKNEFVGRLLNRTRRVTGQGVETKVGSVKALIKALRGGGKVALVIDQNVLPRDGGTFVDFFGLPAPVSRAPAVLARRTGAGLVIGYCLVEPGGYYSIHNIPLDSLKVTSGNGQEMTQTVCDALSGVIRSRPGHWLWMYKRWKIAPAGRSLEGYPFYARHLLPHES
jgi:KDO2-lipid IV(A) lauroyltransferase